MRGSEAAAASAAADGFHREKRELAKNGRPKEGLLCAHVLRKLTRSLLPPFGSQTPNCFVSSNSDPLPSRIELPTCQNCGETRLSILASNASCIDGGMRRNADKKDGSWRGGLSIQAPEGDIVLLAVRSYSADGRTDFDAARERNDSRENNFRRSKLAFLASLRAREIAPFWQHAHNMQQTDGASERAVYLPFSVA